MFIISEITREYIPMWHRERIDKTMSFSITPYKDIFMVIFAFPKACSDEVRTPSKQNKTNMGASILIYLLPIVVLYRVKSNMSRKVNIKKENVRPMIRAKSNPCLILLFTMVILPWA